MRRFRIVALALFLIALFLGVPLSYARSVATSDTGTLGADQYSITSGGSIVPNSTGTKYAYIPLSHGTDTTPVVGGIGTWLISTGLAGTQETAGVLGCIALRDDADSLNFRFQLPETFVDGGVATDLDINFHVSEMGAGTNVSADVAIYEYGGITAIIVDTITVLNGAALGWTGLDTLSTGIGADSDIDADDILTIRISPRNAACDMDIYGMRLEYAPGIEVTE